MNTRTTTCKGMLCPSLSQIMLSTGASLIILFSACSKEGATPALDNAEISSSNAKTNALLPADLRKDNPNLDPTTVWELQQARAATARYQRDTLNAKKDGYVNINVISQNMGWHFMKPSLVDGVFDFRNPEILVYNKNHEGLMELVAVEYAVPISATPDTAPAGFTGNADVWDKNTGFGLWLLHAWVWYPNPSGVFNPTNPDVHVHD